MVTAVVALRLVEEGMETRSLVPSNCSALPFLPAAVQVAPPRMVPLFPLPETSVSVVPAPSSKLYCASAAAGAAYPATAISAVREAKNVKRETGEYFWPRSALHEFTEKTFIAPTL